MKEETNLSRDKCSHVRGSVTAEKSSGFGGYEAGLEPRLCPSGGVVLKEDDLSSLRIGVPPVRWSE